MKWHTFVDVVRKAGQGWVDDRAASMGAALSYYTVFSVAPLLLIVIAVAGLVFGRDAAQGAIVGEIQGLVGRDSAQAIQGLLQNVSEPKDTLLASAIGLLLLLVGATTVFAELQEDLNRIWEVPEQEAPSGVWGWLKARLLSIGLIMAIGFLLLVSLAASAAIAALGNWSSALFGAWETLAQAVNFAVSFGIITALFALIYRYMPQVRIEWRDVWNGAAITALLFTLGKYVIGLYIGKSAVTSGFGAAGSLAAILVWVYYSAQIFLLGAEFTWVFAHEHGSRRHRSPRHAHAEPAASKPGGAAPAGAPEVPRDPPPLPAGRRAANGGRTAVSALARHPAARLALSMGAGLAAVLAFDRYRQHGGRMPKTFRLR